jgi:hypothetical protein
MVYAGDLKSLVPERVVVGSNPTGATGCDGTRRAGCPVLPDKQNGQIRFLVVLLEYLNGYEYTFGHRIAAITLGFDPRDTGSIPVARTKPLCVSSDQVALIRRLARCDTGRRDCGVIHLVDGD